MLYNKKCAAIKKIMLSKATFHGVELEPTAVNFFYGGNGVGKSTIVDVLSTQPESVEWEPNKTAADFDVFVYDQNYIDNNFKSFDNLPGVFTFLEENIKIREQINSARETKIGYEKLINQTTQKISDLQRLQAADKENFYKKCWRDTTEIRRNYPNTQAGFKSSVVKFAEQIIKLVSKANKQDTVELYKLYQTVYDKNAQKYPLLNIPANIYDYKNFKEKHLLKKIIINSGNTTFSSFVRALKATDWILQGRNNYLPKTDGRCPFCQQELPTNFENELAKCFDAEYRNDIQALKKYYEDYLAHMQRLLQSFEIALKNPFPAVKTSGLSEQVSIFKMTVSHNLNIIKEKIREPSKECSKEGTRKILEKIEEILKTLNQKIIRHNTLVDSKIEQQNECRYRVFLHLAAMLKPDIIEFQKKEKNTAAEIQTAKNSLKKLQNLLYNTNVKIQELTEQTVNIVKVKDSINEFLKQAGFQGFYLREKYGDVGAYEVVRENGEIAKKLSEGERNFIAFLYFYHTVCGKLQISDSGKRKIVIIDDPVSSVDSNTILIISSLVRKMVKNCQSGSEISVDSAEDLNIDQIFILTHNVFFHREVTLGQCAQTLFKVVSFYKIQKINNVSRIANCVRQSESAPSQFENYNPASNSYTELWSKYKKSTDAAGILNVIKQILEYYFIHLCGYDEMKLETLILEDNRHKFITEFSNGFVDSTDYDIASAMIQHINHAPIFMDDGLNFSYEEGNLEKYRSVFKKIFDTMEQDQHYNMMMGIQK